MQGLLTKCSHPVRILNKTTGDYMFVPCGHCRNCEHNYTSVWQQRLSLETEYAKSTLFFTLTYDNEHIPSLSHEGDNFVSTDDSRNSSFQLSKFDLISSHYDFTCIPYIVSNRPIDSGLIGVCSKRDIQLFLKRLRRLVAYDSENLLENVSQSDRQIRYICVAEYGPSTFRPHYHGLLWFVNEAVSEAVRKCYLREAWKLCDISRVDVQKVYGNAPDYVSKYICRNTRLPSILQMPETRTFKLYSRFPSIGCVSYSSSDCKITTETRNFMYDKIVTSKKNGTRLVQLPIPKQFYRYWMPRWFQPATITRDFLLSAVTEAFNYAKRYNAVAEIVSIRSCLPNLIKGVISEHRLYDDSYINPNTFNHFTFSDISHLLTNKERIYGVPINRMAVCRAVLFCLIEDIEPLDYVDLYFKFDTSLSSSHLKCRVDFENYARGLDNMQLFLSLFPSFVLNLPSRTPLINHDFYYVHDALVKEYGDFLLSYNLQIDDFYDWHGNLRTQYLYENLRTYHTQFSEYNAFTNFCIDYDVTFEKRRKLNYLNDLKHTNYAIS